VVKMFLVEEDYIPFNLPTMEVQVPLQHGGDLGWSGKKW
jgi:hypothetical protein